MRGWLRVSERKVSSTSPISPVPVAWWLTTKQLMDPADFAAQYGFGISAQALGLLSDGPAAANPAFADYVPLSPSRRTPMTRPRRRAGKSTPTGPTSPLPTRRG